MPAVVFFRIDRVGADRLTPNTVISHYNQLLGTKARL
jgi:hypothetical protein